MREPWGRRVRGKSFGQQRCISIETESKCQDDRVERSIRGDWRVGMLKQLSGEVGKELFYIYRGKSSIANEGTRKGGRYE